jgi:hypothetical protein
MTMKFQLPWAGGPDPETALELRKFDAKFRGEWAWEQPGRFRARWRLNCDGAPVATLATFGVFLAPDFARFADSSWVMRYRFPSETIVSRVGETEPWAHFRPGFFGGGRLSRTGESALLWRRDSFWGRSWSFTTSDHMPLVRFRSHHAFLRRGASIELEDAARRMPDLPALLALGWVLVLRAHRGHAGYH